MGLFDFLKGRKKESAPAQEEAVREKAGSGQEVKYERKLTAREVTDDPRIIQAIVERMVAEDPFQNFYRGKSDDQIVKRIYEYEDITTMNVDLAAEGKTELRLSIEGIPLGTIPPAIAEELNRYREQYLLTAYAYVTGGRYKEYSAEMGAVQEGMSPYDLDIYLQFT